MNKKLLKEFQLQAGGAHYPDINPQLQEQFAQQIVKYCIDLVQNTPLDSVYKTTYDLDLISTAQQKIVENIKREFDVS